MKTKIYILSVFMGFMLLMGCTDNFNAMNIDPNNPTPETIDPDFLLTNAELGGTMNIDLHQRIHSLTVDIFAQYIANEGFSTDRCVPVEGWTNSYWSQHFGWVHAMNDIINNPKNNGSKSNTVQIARIWKVWLNHRATDLWGDMPYSEAGIGIEAGTGNLPKYDSQKDIYYDMVKELKEAAAALDASKMNPGQNDLIFNGDIVKWKKFANSLRLRLAMRMSEVDPAKAKAEAEDAVASNLVLGSNSESVKINRNESYKLWGYYYCYPTYFSWGELAMSKSMENILTGLGGIAFPPSIYGVQYVSVPATVDPRGPIFFNVTSTAIGAMPGYTGLWKGVLPGLSAEEGQKIENISTNNSRIGLFFVAKLNSDGSYDLNNNQDMTLMPYSEICFLRAEGASRGWNMGGTAKDFYEAGITASMQLTGIDAATINTYLNSESPNVNGTTVAFNHISGNHNSQLEKIITQKYISNYPDNGWEAFNDYRRLWMPYLIPFAAPETGYVVEKGSPTWKGSLRRITYPPTEQIVNKKNYEDAVQRIGGDKTTTRVWWDAKNQ
ncbi:MAG: SusD/RagB family nutrient-binding outer membrane lipoprotein [Bacteroidota bacterium]|nr:SusD/RagB family nutrient-binding outer membrane lipoprotein [Bacteroidota bacterium]MDP4205845.1 SusD/RagB family nutrient-binding outer membrane lipoprotein [Bacteroidota bacterium]